MAQRTVALYGDKITSYTDKAKEDYTLETVENLPLVISEDESKNIINVYYKIDGQGVIEPIEPIEPPHTSANNSIYALILLVNALEENDYIPSLEELFNVIYKHIEYQLEIDDKKQANLKLRKHIAWYLKGLNGSSKIRDEVNKSEDIESTKKILKNYYDKLK